MAKRKDDEEPVEYEDAPIRSERDDDDVVFDGEIDPEEESLFLHQQEVAVDDKLRAVVPEKLMRVLRRLYPKCADKLGLHPTPERSLMILPYPLYMERIKHLRGLKMAVAAERTVRSFEMRYSSIVQLDGQNRIRLSPQQATFCGIQKKALIFGDMDWMQITGIEAAEQAQMADAVAYTEACAEVERTKPFPR